MFLKLWMNLLILCGAIITIAGASNVNNRQSSPSIILDDLPGSNFVHDTFDSDAVSITGLNSSSSERNPLIMWLQSLLGIKPSASTNTEKPIVLTPPEHCEPCTCGVLNKKKRIVGGQETEENLYSWMAMLVYVKKFYCGAALINNLYVMTAAHCVTGFNKTNIRVWLLVHDRSNLGSNSQITRNVARVVAHAKYNPSNYNNDIALVQLDKEVKLSNQLCPVCLPVRGKSFTGMEATVTGWGAIQEGGLTAINLQEVTVPILSNTQCGTTKYGPNRITQNMLCAGFEQGGRDSCQGDSGGPLHLNNNTIYSIIGIVSWGEGCAKPKFPGVYTRVNRYRTWIESNTKNACYCN